MKELSIEEKAKVYDKVLTNARMFYKDEHVSDDVNNLLEVLFPELKESEDERIRKKVIDVLKLNVRGAESQMQASRGVDRTFEVYACNKVISWLEKQGEQKPVIEMKTPEESLGIDSETYNKIVDECIYGEQKSDDKVEPKFHKGEWIVHHGTENIYQVVAVIDNQYQLKYGDNYTIQYCADVDRCARLWDITRDAKDGDVLACNEEILLFKSYSVQGRISLYCWYNGQTNNFHSKEVDDTLLTTRNKICPATKEQRERFFAAMHDAGYEWDAEKKELKKISQRMISAEAKEAMYGKPIDKVEPKFKVGDVVCDKSCTTLDKGAQPNLEIVDIRNGLYICDKGYIPISYQDEYVLVAKKIENEIEIPFGAKDSELQEATYYIPEGFHAEIDDDKIAIKKGEKPAWSEEDERSTMDSIFYLKSAKKYLEKDDDILWNEKWFNLCIKWLESLKEKVQFQSTWKPSDKQIEALGRAQAELCSTEYNKPICDLIDSLKKLREE